MSNQRGYTLIEALVVIVALIGISVIAIQSSSISDRNSHARIAGVSLSTYVSAVNDWLSFNSGSESFIEEASSPGIRREGLTWIQDSSCGGEQTETFVECESGHLSRLIRVFDGEAIVSSVSETGGSLRAKIVFPAISEGQVLANDIQGLIALTAQSNSNILARRSTESDTESQIIYCISGATHSECEDNVGSIIALIGYGDISGSFMRTDGSEVMSVPLDFGSTSDVDSDGFSLRQIRGVKRILGMGSDPIYFGKNGEPAPATVSDFGVIIDADAVVLGQIQVYMGDAEVRGGNVVIESEGGSGGNLDAEGNLDVTGSIDVTGDISIGERMTIQHGAQFDGVVVGPTGQGQRLNMHGIVNPNSVYRSMVSRGNTASFGTRLKEVNVSGIVATDSLRIPQISNVNGTCYRQFAIGPNDILYRCQGGKWVQLNDDKSTVVTGVIGDGDHIPYPRQYNPIQCSFFVTNRVFLFDGAGGAPEASVRNTGFHPTAKCDSGDCSYLTSCTESPIALSSTPPPEPEPEPEPESRSHWYAPENTPPNGYGFWYAPEGGYDCYISARGPSGNFNLHGSVWGYAEGSAYRYTCSGHENRCPVQFTCLHDE